MKFTVTRYNGIGETPIVILIDHSYTNDATFDNLEDLKNFLIKKNELVYFVADSKDNRINSLDNWNDNIYPYNHGDVVDRISNYLDLKNESELNSLENQSFEC